MPTHINQLTKLYDVLLKGTEAVDPEWDRLKAASAAGEAVKELTELRAENAFLKSFLQMHSPKMDGQHSYRFRGGWAMNQLIGPNVDDAVKNAMEAVKREQANAD